MTAATTEATKRGTMEATPIHDQLRRESMRPPHPPHPPISSAVFTAANVAAVLVNLVVWVTGLVHICRWIAG